ITFLNQPFAATPDPLQECDELPNDGIDEFMLTDADAQIINGQPDVTVSYYLTLALAEIGDPGDQLISPFTNTVPDNQIVFARLEDDNSGCYDIVELNLIVNPSPAIASPITDFYVCDNDQDGVEIFDLTSKD